MEKSINLTNESIFYTLQGEGKYAGYPSLFVRLSGCNLRCAWQNKDGTVTICDTPYSSFKPDKNMVQVSDLIDELNKYDKSVHLVVTGGEPMLQKNIGEFFDYASKRGHLITVETNGTIYWKNSAQFFSISPKLANSSKDPKYGLMHETKRKDFEALSNIIKNHDYQFKFVYNNISDLYEIEDMRVQLLGMTGIDINDKIWLMPQGVNENQFNQKTKEIWDICKNKGWKFTDRLHIRTYGQMAGV